MGRARRARRARGWPARLTAVVAAVVAACGEPAAETGSSDPARSVAADARLAYLLVPGSKHDHYDVNTSEVGSILGYTLEHGNRDALRRSKRELADLGPEGLEVAVRMARAYWNRPDRSAVLRNAIDVALLSDDPGARTFLREAALHPVEDLRLLAAQGLGRCNEAADWDVLHETLQMASTTYLARIVEAMYQVDRARTAALVLDWVEAGELEPLWGDLLPPLGAVEDPALGRRMCGLWPELLAGYALWPAAACARTGDEDAGIALRAWAEDEDPALRARALAALSQAGMLEPIGRALARDPSSENRTIAASLLSTPPERLAESRDLLFAGISDPDPTVSALCLRALIEAGDPAAIERGFQTLAEPEGRGVRSAMQVLGERLWADPELARRALTVLEDQLQQLEHRGVDEQAAVFTALGRLPLADAALVLLERADRAAAAGDQRIQDMRAEHWLALQAGNVGEAAHALLVEHFGRERDPLRRLDLLEALTLRGGAAARERVLELIDADALSPYELLYVAERLVRIGPTAVVAPALKRATLRVEQDDVRLALQGLLWRSYPAPPPQG